MNDIDFGAVVNHAILRALNNKPFASHATRKSGILGEIGDTGEKRVDFRQHRLTALERAEIETSSNLREPYAMLARHRSVLLARGGLA